MAARPHMHALTVSPPCPHRGQLRSPPSTLAYPAHFSPRKKSVLQHMKYLSCFSKYIYIFSLQSIKYLRCLSLPPPDICIIYSTIRKTLCTFPPYSVVSLGMHKLGKAIVSSPAKSQSRPWGYGTSQELQSQPARTTVPPEGPGCMHHRLSGGRL